MQQTCCFLNAQNELMENGGAGRDRTDDLLLAKQALSQLSYSPLALIAQVKSGGPG